MSASCTYYEHPHYTFACDSIAFFDLCEELACALGRNLKSSCARVLGLFTGIDIVKRDLGTRRQDCVIWLDLPRRLGHQREERIVFEGCGNVVVVWPFYSNRMGER
jgi:hypothetical protein